MRDRVGEARAVHVEAEPARLGEIAERGDLVGRVGQAVFGGVGDRQRVRLDLMHVVADPGEHARHRIGRQLRARSVGEQQLGAVEVEARRAAFVVLDMRVAVADHRAVRLAQARRARGNWPRCPTASTARGPSSRTDRRSARRAAGSSGRRHTRCRAHWPRRSRRSPAGRPGRHCRRRSAWRLLRQS